MTERTVQTPQAVETR